MPALPDTFYIESVMGCNLRCRMCPVPHHHETMNRRKFRVMHIETYKKIINQISDKSRLIYLHMLGEPLLNKYLCDFVAIAKAHGHKVTFSTNGTLMNRKLAERLIVAGLDEIIFSVDGAKRETYEKIRIGADYNGVIKNIRDFYQMKSGTKSKCNVRIHCVISDFTRNEIDKLQYSYGNISDQITTYPLVNLSKDYRIPREFGKTELSAITQRDRYPCEFLWSVLHISAEGNVVFCYKDHQYGNDLIHVEDMSLVDIWNSYIRNERERHISNIFVSEPCKSCNTWKIMQPPSYDTSKYTIINKRIEQTIRNIINHVRV